MFGFQVDGSNSHKLLGKLIAFARRSDGRGSDPHPETSAESYPHPADIYAPDSELGGAISALEVTDPGHSPRSRKRKICGQNHLLLSKISPPCLRLGV